MNNTNQMTNGFNAPDSLHADASPTMPKACVGKTKRDKRVLMLILTFVMTLFLLVLPLFTYSGWIDVDLYATDAVRLHKISRMITEEGKISELLSGGTETMFASMGADITDEDEAALYQDLTNELQQSLNKEIAKVENFAASKIKKADTAFAWMYVCTLVVLVLIAAMIFAAAKNMEKLFAVLNLTTFLCMWGIILFVLHYARAGLDIVGEGLWLGMGMTLVNCGTLFIGKNKMNKNA